MIQIIVTIIVTCCCYRLALALLVWHEKRRQRNRAFGVAVHVDGLDRLTYATDHRVGMAVQSRQGGVEISVWRSSGGIDMLRVELIAGDTGARDRMLYCGAIGPDYLAMGIHDLDGRYLGRASLPCEHDHLLGVVCSVQCEQPEKVIEVEKRGGVQ